MISAQEAKAKSDRERANQTDHIVMINRAIEAACGEGKYEVYYDHMLDDKVAINLAGSLKALGYKAKCVYSNDYRGSSYPQLYICWERK